MFEPMPGYCGPAMDHFGDPGNRSSQRILLKNKTADAAYVVLGCGIGASSRRKCDIFHASPMQQPREAEVSFDTARLHIKPILLVALPGEFLYHGPRLRPHCRIFDGDPVFERSRARSHPALNQVQVLTRALKIGLRAEIRHVDDEGIALPMAARVAIPLPDVSRQVRAAVHHDVALPALALTHVIKDGDAAGRLHDSAEAPDPAAKLGQPGGQATISQRTVLGTVVAIHPPG